METTGIEAAFHKSEELREIDWQEKETFPMCRLLGDFRGEFHDICGIPVLAKCLDPNSDAGGLLDQGSSGLNAVMALWRHLGFSHLDPFRLLSRPS